MRYQNISSMFFRFVTKHAYDGRTDRQNYDPKTALTWLLRAVKIWVQTRSQCSVPRPMSTHCIFYYSTRSHFTELIFFSKLH